MVAGELHIVSWNHVKQLYIYKKKITQGNT